MPVLQAAVQTSRPLCPLRCPLQAPTLVAAAVQWVASAHPGDLAQQSALEPMDAEFQALAWSRALSQVVAAAAMRRCRRCYLPL